MFCVNGLNTDIISHIGSFLDSVDRKACYEASRCFHSIHWSHPEHQINVVCEDDCKEILLDRIRAVRKIKPSLTLLSFSFCCDAACHAFDSVVVRSIGGIPDCHLTFKDACSPNGIATCLTRVKEQSLQEQMNFYLHITFVEPFADMQLITQIATGASIFCKDASSLKSILRCPGMHNILARLTIDSHEKLDPVYQMAWIPTKSTRIQANLTGAPLLQTRDMLSSIVTKLAMLVGYWNSASEVNVKEMYPVVDHIYLAWNKPPSHYVWSRYIRSLPCTLKKISISDFYWKSPFDTFARLDALLTKLQHVNLKLVFHDRASFIHALVIQGALNVLHPTVDIYISNKSMVRKHAYVPDEDLENISRTRTLESLCSVTSDLGFRFPGLYTMLRLLVKSKQ